MAVVVVVEAAVAAAVVGVVEVANYWLMQE